MYRISIWGTGNVAYRLSIELKAAGHAIPFICGRNETSGKKLVHILNKEENNPHKVREITCFTNDFHSLKDSDIIILAVSDDVIETLAKEFSTIAFNDKKIPLLLHTSGATSIEALECYPFIGVLYPLMTLSKIKPVNFKLVPFLIESSSPEGEKILTDIVFSLGSEYMISTSDERLKMHLAAVYVSNFVNYLIGLAFDLSKPYQELLMPLAIETVRKAFLYEHPSIVQTGPAKRGDMQTISKHLKLLEGMNEHKYVYEMLSKLISKQ
jgi:predicted short-subunit dehydrogenase-like oxidoreductase (DUF2520 family)